MQSVMEFMRKRRFNKLLRGTEPAASQFRVLLLQKFQHHDKAAIDSYLGMHIATGVEEIMNLRDERP